MSDDPYAQVEHFDGEAEGENGAQSSRNDAPVLAKHVDVSEDEGWITIPYSMYCNTDTNLSLCFVIVKTMFG